MKKYDFIFGVFSAGKLVFAINRITCTHTMASLIVGVLDIGKASLMEDHYFACDYSHIK